MTRPVGRPPGGTDGQVRAERLALLLSPSEMAALHLAALECDPPQRVSVWAREVLLRAAMTRGAVATRTKNAARTRT